MIELALALYLGHETVTLAVTVGVFLWRRWRINLAAEEARITDPLPPERWDLSEVPTVDILVRVRDGLHRLDDSMGLPKQYGTLAEHRRRIAPVEPTVTRTEPDPLAEWPIFAELEREFAERAAARDRALRTPTMEFQAIVDANYDAVDLAVFDHDWWCTECRNGDHDGECACACPCTLMAVAS